MGCDGFVEDDMARAWANSGADSYVGWNGTITLEETDYYTLQFIESYLHVEDPSEILDEIISSHLRINNTCLCVYLEE